MKRNKILAIVFILLAAVGLATEIALLATASVQNLTYFGHIAVIANVLADAWLAITAVCILTGYGKGKGIMSVLGARVQGAVTTYLLAVSVIFWVLFAWGSDAFVSGDYLKGFVGVGNVFNNAVMPVLMLLIWSFFPVDKRSLGRQMPFAWIFPVYAYFTVLILVGMITGNFAYGFLNPDWVKNLTGGGTFQSLLFAVCLTLIFGIIFYVAGRIVAYIRNTQLAGSGRESTRDLIVIDDADFIRVKRRGFIKGGETLVDGRTEGAVVAANGEYAANRPAVEAYAKPAENGDAFSQLVLGVAYERGDGVPQDYEAAAKWYAKSAAQGNAEALNNLGAVYENGKGVPQDYGIAAELYQESAKRGNANAEYNLANLYHRGAGVDQDYVKAAELYKSAAVKGNAKAQNNLADCYEKGYGVPSDYVAAAEWNKKAAERGDAHAEKHAGISYETAGYPRDSATGYIADDYKAAAENGDADAQFYTGLAYEKGLGTQKNAAAAAKYYQAAAERGNVKAQNKLGNCYYNGQGVAQDYEKAAGFYQKAAERGDPNAFYNLGNCYYNGWGVPQDRERAAILYTKAAERGHAKAQNNLANCYENGQGVARDFASAEYLYNTAAAQGQPDAANRLGVCYEAAGYPEDSGVFETAADDFKNQAERGNPEAQLIMGVSREVGQGVDRDYPRAAEWYEKSAAGGNADAANNLGVLTQYGLGVPQDYEKSVKLYEAAADKGNANALYNLANCYYGGLGVRRDSQKAAKLYKKAADSGHAKAQNNLAYLYEKGDGVRQDADEAAKLYGASAAQGNVYAQNRIGICTESAGYPEGVVIRDVSGYAVVDGAIVTNDGTESALFDLGGYEAERQAADLKAGNDALRAAEEAERRAYQERLEEQARIAEEEAAATALREDETEFSSVESFTVEKSSDTLDGDDESAVIDDDFVEIPDGYTYQDGWYYISDTGERVEKPIAGVGVRDEYYYNLPDELKPEFRELFVDGTRIQIPRFPFYVIDGDNTMFFRLVFTFITRYRKIISIELLDNLYEYLKNRFSSSVSAISKINDKLIRIYFARRKDVGVEEKCENKCREDVEFCLKNVPNYPADLYSYKRLTMILEGQDKLKEARALCVTALELGLIDGTKAGYGGRIKRIDKKIAEKENPQA